MAPAMTAPLFPALTTAEASPSRTSSSATRMEFCFLRRMAWPGWSSMPTTSGAWRTCTGRFQLARSRSSSARTRSSGPTRMIACPLRAASIAPCTIATGALSPPMASNATGAMPGAIGPYAPSVTCRSL